MKRSTFTLVKWQLLYLIIPDGSECAFFHIKPRIFPNELLPEVKFISFLDFFQRNLASEYSHLNDQLRGASPAILPLPDDAGTPVLLEASKVRL